VSGIPGRIHAPNFEVDPSHVQLLVGNLDRRMVALHLVHRAFDLLAHLPRRLLVARGQQALDAFLLQAGTQLGLAAAHRAVAPVACSELASERATISYPSIMPERQA